MLITVLFTRVNRNLHKRAKDVSYSTETPLYALYNDIMKDFSERLKDNESPISFQEIPSAFCKDTRVEKIESELYKNFKITCIQKDISISQGINLALASWLENTNNDHSSMGVGKRERV